LLSLALSADKHALHPVAAQAYLEWAAANPEAARLAREYLRPLINKLIVISFLVLVFLTLLTFMTCAELFCERMIVRVN
jgi:hypothetical protein